jgi:hypothetical protein
LRAGFKWPDEVARFVGQQKLSVNADTYTHVLLDPIESTTKGCCDEVLDRHFRVSHCPRDKWSPQLPFG